MQTTFRNGASLSILCGVLVAAAASAEPKTFDFKDPKNTNSILFVLDSELEPIMGIAQGITGTVAFDADDPKATTGTISIETSKIHCAMSAMTRVLHGADWLDVKTYPTIDFQFKKIKSVRSTKPHETELTVEGTMTIKGTTRSMVVPVRATYLPGKAGKRMRGAKGDLLVLRSTFTINRNDFNIKKGMGSSVVSEEIELRVSIVGYAK